MNFSSVLRRKAFCVFHNHPLSYSLGSLLVPALKVPCSRGTPQSWGSRRDRLLPHRDIHDTIIIQGHLRMTVASVLSWASKVCFHVFPCKPQQAFGLVLRGTDRSCWQGCDHWKSPTLICQMAASSICVQRLDDAWGGREGRWWSHLQLTTAFTPLISHTACSF